MASSCQNAMQSTHSGLNVIDLDQNFNRGHGHGFIITIRAFTDHDPVRSPLINISKLYREFLIFKGLLLNPIIKVFFKVKLLTRARTNSINPISIYTQSPLSLSLFTQSNHIMIFQMSTITTFLQTKLNNFC